jgi:hypothetical protein
MKQEGSTQFNCVKCGGLIDDHPEEVKKIDGKPVHDECFYEELGKLVEASPIIAAGLRRG